MRSLTYGNVLVAAPVKSAERRIKFSASRMSIEADFHVGGGLLFVSQKRHAFLVGPFGGSSSHGCSERVLGLLYIGAVGAI